MQVTRSETLIHAQRFQRFRVTLDLHNRGPIPIHYLTVTDTYGSFVVRGGSFMVALPPGERRQVTYEAESHYRGEFKLGPVRLRGADPMGFFRWDHQSPTPATVLVYPAVFPVEMHEKDGLPSGSITVSQPPLRRHDPVPLRTRVRGRRRAEAHQLEGVGAHGQAVLHRVHAVDLLPGHDRAEP